MQRRTTNKLSEIMAKADNRYVLVHAVAKRAKKILEGSAQSNMEMSNNKAIVTSIQEIIAEESHN
ncbi:MAG: DNA-directed RNA polymerase subunit omega [Candidatus Sericytochromatia bacterium]